MTDYENLDGLPIEGRLDYWRKRALKAEAALEDQKDIGRAKAQMIRDGGFAEPEAHRYIQQRAMNERRTMGAVAREILVLGAVPDGAQS